MLIEKVIFGMAQDIKYARNKLYKKFAHRKGTPFKRQAINIYS